MKTEAGLIKLDESQIDRGAELLARTFQHDPMMQYLVSDQTRMLDKPLRFYRASIRMGLLYGEVYTTPSLDGIAIWVSPGNTDFNFGQLARSGFLTAMLSIGVKPLARFIAAANFVQRLEKQAITGPRWLLVFVGVEPSQQGKGIGNILLKPIMDRADKESLPCYLESTNERNLTFYKRLGFKVAAHGQIPNGGPQMWVMVKASGNREITN